MPGTRRVPPGCAVVVLIVGTCAQAAPRVGTPIANADSSTGRDKLHPPWLLKITPVYGRSIERIEFAYAHRQAPWLLRHEAERETFIRPTVRLLPATGHAWFGLDADLAWEGRCSLTGQWLVADVDGSDGGLLGADLFYDLRARRLLVRTTDGPVIIDMTNGRMTGTSLPAASKGNLRDHFLARGNRPFELRAGADGAYGGSVWILPDLASIALGRTRAAAEDRDNRVDAPREIRLPTDLSTEHAQALRRALAELQAVDPHHADPAAKLNQRRWTFGVDQPVKHSSTPEAKLPTQLAAWPGKSLAHDAARRLSPAHEAAARRAIALMTNHWQARRRWLARTPANRTSLGSTEIETPRDARIARRIDELARLCELSIDGTSATERPADVSLRTDTLAVADRLRRLDKQITELLTSASEAAETARTAPRPHMTLPQAELACQGLAIGCELRDEAACLMVDLVTSQRPAPTDAFALAQRLAERLIARGWNDLLAEQWDRDGVLALAAMNPAGRNAKDLLTDLTTRSARDRDRLHDVGHRVARAFASACYEDAQHADLFRQHLLRRFPCVLATEGKHIAALVRDLDEGGVVHPDGLAQLQRVCGNRANTPQDASHDIDQAMRVAQGLTELALEHIDRLAMRWTAVANQSKQVANDYARAYAAQQDDVARLIEWVCRTYAGPIFGKGGLDTHQRKRLILATAAWWARQWDMDLCWTWCDFGIDVSRQDDAIGWRVRDLRIVLLDRPNPQAQAEERMARADPPQPLPVGPVRLADGRTARPRSIRDFEMSANDHGNAEAVARAEPSPESTKPAEPVSKDDAASAHMLLPQRPEAMLADAEVAEPPPAPRSPTSPAPASESAPTVAATPASTSDDASAAAPSADAAPASAVPTPPTSQPASVTPAPTPQRSRAPRIASPSESEPLFEPPTQGDERVVPVMLRPDKPSRPRRVAIRAGQTVRLVGMASFVTSPRRCVRVTVELLAGGPVAAELVMRSSPPMTEHGRATLIERGGESWWRRTIRWARLDALDESFDVTFEAPRPEHPGQTLTMAFGVETGEHDNPTHQPEQIVEFLLMD